MNDAEVEIMLASNKVVVDSWDDPKQTSLSQVAFSLYELVYAYEEMKARKMLPDAALRRTYTAAVQTDKDERFEWAKR